MRSGGAGDKQAMLWLRTGTQLGKEHIDGSFGYL
jgi:hypothetical protein